MVFWLMRVQYALIFMKIIVLWHAKSTTEYSFKPTYGRFSWKLLRNKCFLRKTLLDLLPTTLIYWIEGTAFYCNSHLISAKYVRCYRSPTPENSLVKPTILYSFTTSLRVNFTFVISCCYVWYINIMYTYSRWCLP